ncbi:hypothetical protein BGW36DRAFT_444961 [Talaromyces proteolyticus]|uniref:Uncharacterized protein n=1 Tax=Talaromyces proteolyticus TaxID=1131652 RepID=A0AAD4Q5R8_9EURO|nr:uncharacterized protein BGW36DRAFT_444961 [Talaromyces proteolyticus]KAH8704255.1 hypothetical protein BGW36DRAFT_444961 [Talaromyces proteolyticus]
MSSTIHDAVGRMKVSLRNNRDLPPVRLSNVAKEFVDNRVEINGCRAIDLPVADGSSPIDKARKELPVDEADIVDPHEDIHCKHFAEVLQSFENALPDKYKTRFKLQDKHSWSEVIEEASIAEMKYKKKSSESPFGKVRGFFRSLQKRSAIIENWLDLLPTQSQYGSLICGGIKMILRAATRMDEVKEFIFKALATIPDEVEKAQLMIDYNQDLQAFSRLYNRVSSLYSTIFGILEHIITWYGQKCAPRYFKAIIQQSSYEKVLEDKIKEFKEVVSSVMSEALLCGMNRFQVMDARLQEILDCVYGVVLSNPRINPQTGQMLQPQPIPKQVQRGKAISRQSLCESILRYDGDIPLTDLTVVMHRGTELSLEEQDRIVYVINSESLRNWLLEPTKATLLISGHSEDFGSGISSMSFLAAHVVQSTRQAQKNRPICLHWFTHQHRDTRKDADANVHGIIRHLIGQLLHARTGFDLYFIKRSTAILMRENDLKVLCDVFDQLIFQLPQKTVTFCVLDWLACLEYHERTEVQYLLKRLRAIARHTSGEGSLFKLLLTHPGGAFRAAAIFSPEEALDVPEAGDGNRMGFNSLMWNAKVGGNINQLSLKSTQ